MTVEFKNILRIGLFKEFDYSSQTAIVQMFDRSPENSIERCDMPLSSWGIYSFPKRNTRVLIGYGYREKPYIVSVLPSAAFAQDLSSSANTINVSVNDVQYPRLESGEVAIQGLQNSQVVFKKSGDVNLVFGQSQISFSSKDIYSENTNSHYLNTEAGRWLSGPVKRDLRKAVSETNKTLDKLVSTTYELVLSEIGKNPIYRTAVVTNNLGGTNEVMRNPPLVEEHHITYEFARSYMVGSSDEEKERVFQNTQDKDFLSQPDRRDMSRSDILNLNDVFKNNLIEEVRGTVVDRYGNILDLNRNIINYQETSELLKNKDKRTDLEDLFLRRAIKYHFEINARKDRALGNPNYSSIDGPDVKNGHPHSRWFVDVDGEGLTKINIPASSNFGNIPLLTRYVNTSLESGNNTDSFRDGANSPPRDVTHLAFGSNGGFTVDGSYLPPKVTKSVMAYHDITTTAKDIVTPIMTTNLSNTAGSQNAGGKSAHVNLDGSLELNVGRDYVDHKSIMLDTSGSVISRIGKDKNNNSVISQVDGHISVQVGGDTISNSTSTESPVQDPTVKIYIKTASGNFDKIEVTKDAIVIESSPNKNIVFKSGNNIVLDAAGQTFIGGEAISFYGTASRDGKTLAPERLLARVGNIIA
jgi:hypothetical protein